jgi:hypothetical protein
MALNDYSGEKLSRANPMVKRVLAVAFPDYTGRKIKARLWTRPTVLQNYWDGGTRSYYVAIRIVDGAVSDFGTDNPFVRSTHDPVDLPAGVLLVEHSYFCGHDMGITIWARAEALGQGITPALLASGA